MKINFSIILFSSLSGYYSTNISPASCQLARRNFLKMIEQKIEQKTISKTCGCEKSQFRCWFSCCLMFISELASRQALPRSYLYLAPGTFSPLPWMFSTSQSNMSSVGSMASALLQHRYTTDLIHTRSYHKFMLSNRSENVLRKCFCYFFLILQILVTPWEMLCSYWCQGGLSQFDRNNSECKINVGTWEPSVSRVCCCRIFYQQMVE